MVAAFKKCDGVVDASATKTDGKEEGFAKVKYDPAKTNPAKLVKDFNVAGGPKYHASEQETQPPK